MNIIADIGSNWYNRSNSRERLSELISEASRHGATAIKAQLFQGESLYRDKEKIKAVKKTELPDSWLSSIKDEVSSFGMEFIVSPYYVDAVGELESIGIRKYKVASADITFIPLLQEIAKTNKPVILSTGAATYAEIATAIAMLRPDKHIDDCANDIELLYCVPSYPAIIQEANLIKILQIASEFIPLRVGFSSHIVNPYLTAATVFFGVETIEVFVDLDDGEGIETRHSYSPKQLAELVKYTKLFSDSMRCGCKETFADFNARMSYYRDPSDWLRPVLKKREME
jgi:N,N'-diacetyllegionaminate synthase